MNGNKRDIYTELKSVDPETGFVYEEQYLKNGELHRENGPARITRNLFENGHYSLCEEWWLEGHEGRLGEGPVFTLRDMPHDTMRSRMYLRNGERIMERQLSDDLKTEYGLNLD